ncbi:DUF6171 family protein [Exiguobacterium sp. SH0S7]|uniref:DUF6171 family protein n=1 Tax=Exiguobacterium sp. SH0S7 TaxID=2510951 RepID=UPI0013157A5D|nr:DUF6171 family protein [Exiguobacterium sp. SH0S7]
MTVVETRRCRTCLPQETDTDWLLTIDAEVMDQVPDAEYEARLTHCAACPFRQQDTCLKCGCYVSYRARLATKHCPLNVW